MVGHLLSVVDVFILQLLSEGERKLVMVVTVLYLPCSLRVGSTEYLKKAKQRSWNIDTSMEVLDRHQIQPTILVAGAELYVLLLGSIPIAWSCRGRDGRAPPRNPSLTRSALDAFSPLYFFTCQVVRGRFVASASARARDDRGDRYDTRYLELEVVPFLSTVQ